MTYRQNDNYTHIYDGKMANCCQKGQRQQNKTKTKTTTKTNNPPPPLRSPPPPQKKKKKKKKKRENNNNKKKEKDNNNNQIKIKTTTTTSTKTTTTATKFADITRLGRGGGGLGLGGGRGSCEHNEGQDCFHSQLHIILYALALQILQRRKSHITAACRLILRESVRPQQTCVLSVKILSLFVRTEFVNVPMTTSRSKTIRAVSL